ncbi:MlaD family protein [Sulfurimonas sp.]|nr:MlaD family protein [Sulfurimonas sp.]
MQYNKMNFTVGLFMLSLFLLLFAFIFFLLEEKGTFEKRYNYHFTTQSAESFSVGMPLKFSGFNIGVIDNISLEEDGSVVITFSVRETNAKWLSQGSVLMLIKPLLGAAHINLYTSLDSQPLKDGEVIPIHISDNINDLIVKLQPIVSKSLNVLNSVDKITTELASENSNLKKILQNLTIFSERLVENNSLLTSVTGDKDSTKNVIKSLNETTRILKDVKKITSDISKITKTLNQDIVQPTSSTIKEMEVIMKDVRSKLETIDDTVKAIGGYDKDLVELKKQITTGIQKSNQIMDKVDSMMQNETNSKIELP